jgi:hypothetical protein
MVQLKLMRLSMFLPIAVLDLSGASSCVYHAVSHWKLTGISQ